MNNLLFPRLVVFAVCVVAFFVGVYFNKRDDEKDKALYEERRKQARERQLEQARLQPPFIERRRSSSVVQAMAPESPTGGLGAGAAGQIPGDQPKRVN